MADITLIPVIISAVLTPNPAQAEGTVHISVAAGGRGPDVNPALRGVLPR